MSKEKPPKRLRDLKDEELAERLFGKDVVREVKREVGDSQAPEKTEDSEDDSATDREDR